MVLESGEFPEAWTTGVIIPIHKKKGEGSNPNNYRGITLVSVMGKIFTKFLNGRIESFIDLNGILLDNQAAFRKNRSTTDQICNPELS